MGLKSVDNQGLEEEEDVRTGERKECVCVGEGVKNKLVCSFVIKTVPLYFRALGAVS